MKIKWSELMPAITLLIVTIGGIVAFLVLLGFGAKLDRQLQDLQAIIKAQQQTINQIKQSEQRIEDNSNTNTAYLKCLLAIDTNQPDAQAPCPLPSSLAPISTPTGSQTNADPSAPQPTTPAPKTPQTAPTQPVPTPSLICTLSAGLLGC